MGIPATATNTPAPDGNEAARFRRVMEFDLKPMDIAAKLRETVLGQDHACRALAVRLRQHILRVREMDFTGASSNSQRLPAPDGGVLLLGPTGCGKTHLLRTLAELSSLVCHIEDATNLTETGYIGRDVSDVATAVFRAAGGHMPLATTAMLFVDEVDKLRSRPDGNGKDITGEGVQRSLLCLLGGAEIPFSVDGRSRGRDSGFRTDGLFITLAGAFSGLDQLIARRLGRRGPSFGFGRSTVQNDRDRRQGELLNEVTAEDLIDYGFMPELVGRIGEFVIIQPLDTEAMKAVLLHEHGPLEATRRIAAAEGFGIELTGELVALIARQAVDSGQGARVLKRIVSQVTRRALFEMPSRVMTRSTPVAVLGVSALEDGSYEVKRRSVGRRCKKTDEVAGAVTAGAARDGNKLCEPSAA
ncbi:MAG: AAA family ATPase [Armatimonadetes bacterium]|nr:AAA family ATPase [Armatimonadota bacterium]MDI9585509.1 AAA family ATPase [Acidobacteriota bacterium]